MADSRISELTALITAATNDLLEILDVSDTSMGAGGTNKKITLANLMLLLFASPTFTGTATMPNTNFGAHTAYFTETDNGNSSTADTINWGLSNKQKSTLTGNCTYTFTAPSGPCNLILKVLTGAGGFSPTFPASVKWSGGVTPTPTTTAGRVDVYAFYYDGTDYFGSMLPNFTP